MSNRRKPEKSRDGAHETLPYADSEMFTEQHYPHEGQGQKSRQGHAQQQQPLSYAQQQQEQQQQHYHQQHLQNHNNSNPSSNNHQSPHDSHHYAGNEQISEYYDDTRFNDNLKRKHDVEYNHQGEWFVLIVLWLSPLF